MVVKPKKNQRGNQKGQDVIWKVHDRRQAFVFRLYTVHKLREQNVYIG